MKEGIKMRDVNRILRITSRIADKWYDKCPDWRFMQMVCNFMAWLGSDVFYLEDDKFEEKFNEFMEGVGRNRT